MNPFMLLAEAGTFDPAGALELVKTVITFLLNLIKGEPILSCAFVVAILVPAGFGIVRKIKGLSR